KVSLNSTDPVLKINDRYRRFTPREVARIQSFPDSYKLVRAEGTQYKALGNAIPPVLMWNVGMKLANALSEFINSDKCEKKIQLIS
ncbi:DNA cytosine methyltransferase, partial [Acinetobacter baumannii]|nr:DNA cytosine methyltransferase [Acinetobacter baumannii]